MNSGIWLTLAAFSLTYAETLIATRRTNALIRVNEARGFDRVSFRKLRFKAAGWEAFLDFVLIIDMFLVVTYLWLIIPVVIGSWFGSLHATRLHPESTYVSLGSP